MKKILFILFSVLMITGCTSTDVDENQILRVGMELAYPPFETKDEAGNPVGISVDIAYAFGEYIGQEVIIENIEWGGLIPSLETEKVDIVISSMTITDDRKKTIDFSDPYAKSLLALLVNKDSNIKNIEELDVEGNKLAVKSGSTGHIYANNNIKNAEVVVLADESAAITEVTQGLVDGFIYDQLTIYRNYQRNQETTNAIFIPFQDVEYWGIGVKKGNTELLDELNLFINELYISGDLNEISEKHLSEEKKVFDELGFTWFFDLD